MYDRLRSLEDLMLSPLSSVESSDLFDFMESNELSKGDLDLELVCLVILLMVRSTRYTPVLIAWIGFRSS